MSGKRYPGKITVFLSYQMKDRSIAKIIANLLSVYPDIRVFDSSEDIKPGDSWEGKIRREIDKCSLFLTLITPTALTSDWVSIEIGAAWAAYKTIVPIVTDPKLLHESVIRDFQHILLDDIGKPEVIQRLVELAREAKIAEAAAKTKVRKSA